ncbi:hypothetical protein OG520_21800 [Streptomyces sp. NBC_00984]|uniref:hypothetical protein n=1 Tax=Streptomyces sp. NBC_00984 TaxID=2903700 RepID=UPI0038676FAB|nr:hypothetical protein OG520_21800 [Streptomyces sp. NBC_00984]
MFHRIRTCLPRTLVQVVLPFLARVLRVLRAPTPVTPVPPSAPAPRIGAHPHPRPQLPYAQSPRPIDPGRRAHRTAMRLALDGLVVVAGVGQAHSVGSLVLATTRRAA